MSGYKGRWDRVRARLAALSPAGRRRAERMAAAAFSTTVVDEGLEDASRVLEATETGVHFAEGWAFEGADPEDDPALDWCAAETEKGARCTMDAVRDGLCKRHWRMENNGWTDEELDPYSPQYVGDPCSTGRPERRRKSGIGGPPA